MHLIGKEIVRHHTVYWPAFLMAAGLPLPRRVIGHGWWLMNEAKMSKSLGNVVQPQGYVERFGVDALRYFVMREMVVGQDATSPTRRSSTRYNADLANDLGNVVSRVTTMIQRYCDGVVPAPAGGPRAGSTPSCAARVATAIDARRRGARRVRLQRRRCATIWELISALNKYIVTREPWALAKNAGVAAAARGDAVQRRRRAAGRRGAHRPGHAGDRRADPRACWGRDAESLGRTCRPAR